MPMAQAASEFTNRTVHSKARSGSYGNYPVATGNVALGDTALDSLPRLASNNTALGTEALTSNASGTRNTTAMGRAVLNSTTGLSEQRLWFSRFI